MWLQEVVSILRSENGPHGATKKEYEKAKVLMNQFLAADSHMKPVSNPNPQPTVVSGESESETGIQNSSPHGSTNAVAMVNAYPVDNIETNTK